MVGSTTKKLIRLYAMQVFQTFSILCHCANGLRSLISYYYCYYQLNWSVRIEPNRFSTLDVSHVDDNISERNDETVDGPITCRDIQFIIEINLLFHMFHKSKS